MKSIWTNLGLISREILIKLTVAILITFVISMVSFRSIWMTDVFHIVFLTNLLSRRVYNYLKRLFE